jgi:formylglycine-generating enzyme required for sulfatase activity
MRLDEPRRKRRPTWPRATLGIAIAFVILPALLGWGDDSTAPGAGTTWIRHPTKPFSIVATEVTVGQFRTCVNAGACDASTTNTACNYGQPNHDNHPVNCVAYQGAEQYCRYVGGRVCSEEEWLDACRGTDGRQFPYGDTFDINACNAQSHTQTVEGRERATLPVASLSQCEGGLTGLFDMAGNVAEWVSDCKGAYCRFRGAGYLSNDPIASFAACGSICSGNDQSFQSGIVGIRCCRDESD